MAILRTTLLLGILTAILLGFGFLLGGTGGVILAFVLALIINFASYWFSDKIVLRIYRAQPLKDKKIEDIVSRIAKGAGIPVPKLYFVNEAVPNAFATGRNPEHAAVAVTKGLKEVLNEEEIEGVLAHEISHIKNRDTLVSTMAATIGGAVSFLANMAWWLSLGGNRREGGMLIFLPLVILAPIAAGLVQLAISRGRELGADYTGALVTKNPLALASALQKISAVAKAHPLKGNPAGSHLWIVNPFSAGWISGLFSTHPSTEERVRRLKEMKH